MGASALRTMYGYYLPPCSLSPSVMYMLLSVCCCSCCCLSYTPFPRLAARLCRSVRAHTDLFFINTLRVLRSCMPLFSRCDYLLNYT